MNALYKPGDRVLIKSKYDEGADTSSYKFFFTPQMLNTFGGHVCTIESVSYYGHNNLYQVKDDGYEYRIKEDNVQYSWSSGMFESEF